MAIKRPQAKTVLLFFICVVCVLTSAYFAGFWGKTVSSKVPTAQDLSVKKPAILEDGVNNDEWKKVLSNFTDTDNQASVQENTSTVGTVSDKTAPDTETDAFGRAFFTAFINLKQSGSIDNTEQVDKATTDIIDYSIERLPTPKVYSMLDIKINNDDSKESINSYMLSLQSLTDGYLPKENQSMIVMEAYEEGDMTVLSRLDKVISGYRTMITRMQNMPVPQSAVGYHIDLMNAFSMNQFNAESLRDIETDPMKALAALSIEVMAVENISNAIDAINKYFNENTL